ncbi:hypothetical protein M8J76_015560 [Diaphorina citri]|nr:hypothetical protein M8J75_010515 [Diaphorina citri]KAI5741634.1 hypothetical protein M8J76_015560 [Diaphorina citri]
MNTKVILLCFLLICSQYTEAGPIAMATAQAGCAAVVMACYAAAGATWGATLGATAPASVIACNSAFGVCMTAASSFLLAPIP